MAFVGSRAPYPAFVGGYGSGKTHAAVWRALHLMLRDRVNIAYYMPTIDLIRQIGFKVAREQCERMGLHVTARESPPFSITVHGFGELLFRSMDRPESIIGYEVGHSLADELDVLQADKAEDVWRRALARNRTNIPNGNPNTIGVATTPEGFRFVYKRWHAKVQPGYELIRAKTADNARNLPPGYIKSLEDVYPSALLRAYLDGEFVNLSDGLVQGAWFKLGDPPPGTPLVLAFDLAISLKDGADYTAYAVMGRAPEGQIYIPAAGRSRVTFHQTQEWVVNLAERHRPKVIGLESQQYQAAAVQELLRTTSLNVVELRAEKDKATRLMPLAARYEQGLVYHARGLNTLEDELISFPHGANDDLVDAAAHAYRLLDFVGAGTVASAGRRRFAAR